MTKEFWFNLSVKDLTKSRKFFKDIGFISNPMHENNAHMASFFIGEKKIVMMLFPEETFKGLVSKTAENGSKSSGVLFNIDGQNREAVDAMALRVEKAGGTIYATPSEKEGWMYGCGFEDLDGHSWNILYMDFEKMPK